MADVPEIPTERIFHECKFVFLSCAHVERGAVVHTIVDVTPPIRVFITVGSITFLKRLPAKNRFQCQAKGVIRHQSCVLDPDTACNQKLRLRWMNCCKLFHHEALVQSSHSRFMSVPMAFQALRCVELPGNISE